MHNNTARKPDGSMNITIARKATHTDHYLHVAANHPLERKLSVVHDRARMVISEEHDRAIEVAHVIHASDTVDTQIGQ